jgi:predicted negative regulator of RcsB-dependent stress response
MAYDDYEQGERVREWLRQNGLAIIIGLAIGLALIFGYRQWTKHRANQQAQAATQYQMIQNAVASGKTREADTLTDSLEKNHADSAYAVFAASLRAQRQLADGHAGKAVTSLEWALGHAHAKPLADLTRIRLARAYLAAGKPGETIKVLKAMPADAYAGMVAELNGDALVKQGHSGAAIKHYRAAMAAFDTGAPQQQILKMKIANLGSAAPVKPVAHAASTATPSSSKKQDA